MSLLYKLIIPFLDENITKEDISPEAGFVDAYCRDINRPYLEHFIFLLYDAQINTKEAHLREIKFSKLKTIHSKKIYVKDNHYYYVYAFPIINPAIDNLLLGIRPTTIESNIVLVKFYGIEDVDIINYLFKGSTWGNLNSTLPEEDYVPTISDIRNMKKGRAPKLELDL